MILLIDGNNAFFRCFAAISAGDTNGNPIGGVIGCIRMVKWLLRETQADRVFWVWDAPGGSKKRRAILSEYKAGRKPRMNREVDENVTDSRDNLVWQIDKVQQLLKLLGVTQITVQDIEADDAIGYMVGLLEGHRKVVVSSDKDMWQLIDDTTTVYWPVKKVYINTGTFIDYSPFHKDNYVLARALAMGDNSDNIKGLKGLGEKTLLKIFPFLATKPTSFSELLEYVRDRLQLVGKDESKLSASEKRWFPVIVANNELVRQNLQLMQLTSPIISATAASTIRHAVQEVKPTFDIINFKLSLINAGIQLTDNDLYTTLQEYKRRVFGGVK